MIVDIYNTNNQYNLILADPPWKQAKGGKKSVRPISSGTELDYPVCSLEEIKEHLRQATSLVSGGEQHFVLVDDRQVFIRGTANSGGTWV